MAIIAIFLYRTSLKNSLRAHLYRQVLYTCENMWLTDYNNNSDTMDLNYFVNYDILSVVFKF